MLLFYSFPQLSFIHFSTDVLSHGHIYFFEMIITAMYLIC